MGHIYLYDSIKSIPKNAQVYIGSIQILSFDEIHWKFWENKYIKNFQKVINLRKKWRSEKVFG